MKESQLRRLIKKQIKESLREERMGPYKPFDIDDEIGTNDFTWEECCNLYKSGDGGHAECCKYVVSRDGDNTQQSDIPIRERGVSIGGNSSSDPCECCYGGHNIMIKKICCKFCNRNVFGDDD